MGQALDWIPLHARFCKTILLVLRKPTCREANLGQHAWLSSTSEEDCLLPKSRDIFTACINLTSIKSTRLKVLYLSKVSNSMQMVLFKFVTLLKKRWKSVYFRFASIYCCNFSFIWRHIVFVRVHIAIVQQLPCSMLVNFCAYFSKICFNGTFSTI